MWGEQRDAERLRLAADISAGPPEGAVELDNWDRVGHALKILARGLVSFVDRFMAAFLPSGRDWLQVMIERARRDGRPTALVRSDPRLLLQVIGENQRAFRGSLSKLELAYARETREVANRWAHLAAFSDPDTSRALDTIVRLLRAAGAVREAGEVAELLSGHQRASAEESRVAREEDAGESGGPVGLVGPGQGQVTACDPVIGGARTAGGVVEFRDRDRGYLDWVAAHSAGYVLNIGRSGRGYAVLHRSACGTIRSRAPFTGPYMKVCSTSLGQLDEWALRRNDAVAQRCGICQPPSGAVSAADAGPPERARSAVSAAGPPLAAVPRWHAEGPENVLREVWLWAGHYLPFERLSLDQRDARDDLRRRLRSLEAGAGEILHASYAGPKPPNADVENLVLYNIDTTASGCFRPSTRHGIRFEMAPRPRRDPPSGRFACSYRYRLISPGSELTYWRPASRLARFTAADLGQFPSTRRLEQAWLAIHRAEAVAAGQQIAEGMPFATFLTLTYPPGTATTANPELVKALIDAAAAAFQAHGDRAGLGQIAQRIAAATGQPPDAIAEILADDRRAVLGVADRLVHLRDAGVQWNPCDHMCMAGQVTCQPADGSNWMLAGEIHALEPQQDTTRQ